ncbi:MAG: hypothetical protein JWQ14_3525 [Adhaeribacter sp.]|nr:hypothetical protein [Adhaeribacter sp.]
MFAVILKSPSRIPFNYQYVQPFYSLLKSFMFIPNFSFWLLKYAVISMFLLIQAPLLLFSPITTKEKIQLLKQCSYPIAIIIGICLIAFGNVFLGLLLGAGALILGALRAQFNGYF